MRQTPVFEHYLASTTCNFSTPSTQCMSAAGGVERAMCGEGPHGACTTSIRPVGLRGWRHAIRTEASCKAISIDRRRWGRRFRRASMESVEKGKQSRLVEILTRPVWLQLWLAAGLSKPLFLAGHGYRFQARKARRDRVRMDSCRWHIYFPTGRHAVPSVLVEPKTFADHQMPLRSQSNERWGLQDWLGGINDMVREVGAAGG
ncbi:hypothetical protein HDK77DRAFT_258363 [Phyllosticta capitalensis]